jgi:hypothetical protein
VSTVDGEPDGEKGTSEQKRRHYYVSDPVVAAKFAIK